MKILLLSVLISFISCASNKNKDIDPKLKKAQIFYAQGTRNLIAQEYTRALKNLLEAFKLNPIDSKINNNLGMAYYFKRNNAKALRFVRKSVQLDPKNTDAKINLATIYMNQKKFSSAEKVYNEVAKDLTYEGQYRTFFNLGLLKQKTSQHKEAFSFFKKALSENESYCPAHFQMGHIYYKEKQFTKALQSYKNSGLGVCYQSPEPQYYQALALIKLKQFELANSKLEDISERFPFSKYKDLAQKRKKEIILLEKRSQLMNRKILSPGF